MRWFRVFPPLLLIASCGDGAEPGDVPTRLIEVSGAADFAAVPLDTVPEALVVRVTDLFQHPVPGVEVHWSTVDGGVLVPEASATGPDGVAVARWKLGWRPGVQRAQATVGGAVDPAPFTATARGFQASGLSTGNGDHQCGIDPDGRLFCWGPNGSGQLGDGTTTTSDAPVAVLLSQPIAQVVTGSSFTCALTAAGEVYCWGSNQFGQLGDGTTDARLSPVRAQLPTIPFKSLSAKYSGVCAVGSGGEGYCWGNNEDGRFGTGTADDTVTTPAPVGGGYAWHSLTLGDESSCGVREGGQVYCWGRAFAGPVPGVDTNTVWPLPVPGAPPMDSLALTGWHQCGITPANVTWCWGWNHNIGVDDPRDFIPDPIQLAAPPGFLSIHGLHTATFALGTDGHGYWWGPPPLSNGGPPETPERFSDEIPLRSIGTNDSGACGIEQTSGTVYCWSAFVWEGPTRVAAFPPPGEAQ